MNNIIEIKNATVQKDQYTLLDDISLTINKNEHIAIIGPNGSGKTSLLKLITRDYYPIFNKDSYVKIFGKTVWDIFELRSHIGIVSDNITKFYNTSCYGEETILSGFFSSIGIYSTHKITDKMHTKADELMDFFSISHLKNKKLYQMSSGEMNRFLVARSLVNDPESLLLDEPTSNLDIKAMSIFLSFIRKLANHNKTIIMVTHHIHDIIPEIDRIIMIKNGKIFKDGNKAKLLTGKILSGLFDYKIEIAEKGGFYSYV